MIQLAYISCASKHMSTEQLFEMLLECRLNNRRNHLTGLLLFCGESFLQILEGPEENVGSIYKKICMDTRHKDFKLLFKKEISKCTSIVGEE